MNNQDLEFQREVMKKFNELNNRFDYWQRDMEEAIGVLETRNEELEELLTELKKLK